MADKIFSVRLKRDFNGHKRGTILGGVKAARDERGRYYYRRDVAQENFPISVIEELDE